MRSNKLIISLLLVFLLYRILPVFQGSPVFSIDAWPLLANSLNLIELGHAHFFSCVQQISCYYSTWPYLEILTAQLAELTDIPRLFITIPITIFAATIQFVSILLLSHFLTKSRLPAAIFLLADAPANIFYSGFKQEMYAMPLLALVIAFVIKRKLSLSKKDILTLSLLMIGILFGHHYTTYILLVALIGSGIYILIKPGLKISRGYAFLLILLVTMFFAYYASQFDLISSVSGYNLSFIMTLFSYNVVFGIIMFRVLDRSKLRYRFPLFSSIFALAAIMTVPMLSKILYTPVSSPSLLSELTFFFTLIPLCALGIPAIISTDKHSASIILFWLTAPLSLALFAIFDGNPILAYRGYVASTLPLTIIFSSAAICLFHSKADFGRYSRSALGVFIAASIIFGIFTQLQPVYSTRDIYNGSTWLYPMSHMSMSSDFFALLPKNMTVYTDLPTLSYSYMFSIKNVHPAIPQYFAQESEKGLLLLQNYDLNDFYFFGNYASLPVNISVINGCALIFSSPDYNACL